MLEPQESLVIAGDAMIYLVGVDHQIQYRGSNMTPEREEATRAFKEFIVAKSKQLNVSLIAEEFNEDVVKRNHASSVTLMEVASQLGIDHRFSDPTVQQRKDLGIGKDLDRREEFWITSLKDALNRDIIFVCGAAHLNTFRKKLTAKGLEAEILPEQFGIGLPRPTLFNNTSAVIPELEE
jgi:hypothetical protein